MNNSLHPFYLILDNADWIERLVPLGVKLVQLRFKSDQNDLICEEINRAKTICEKYDCQLIVNDYWQAAIDLKCDYIHLGQEDLDTADIKAIKKAGIKFGISTHDEKELERALSLKPNYIALGPIFNTTTKIVGHEPQGFKKITRWKQLISDLPLIAIGGITLEKADDIFQAGANSIAIISDITKNTSPEERVNTWLETVSK